VQLQEISRYGYFEGKEVVEMLWKTWTLGIVGLWLVLAAFLGFTQQGNLWNNLIVGLIAIVAAFGMVSTKPGQAWTAGVLGAWLVVAAFIPAVVSGPGLLWNNVIVGTVIALSGFMAMQKTLPSESRPHPGEGQHLHQH